ncbi:MAG: phage holin family protein [Candidatus Paceibacterota bacterium]|jgi:putative membrane protein
MRLIAKWIIVALAVFATPYFISGIIVDGFYVAFVTALLLGIVSVTIKPLAILITLPINIITLGLFTLVINGALLWMLSTFVKGFEVASFWSAFLAALFISVVTFIAEKIFLRDDE